MKHEVNHLIVAVDTARTAGKPADVVAVIGNKMVIIDHKMAVYGGTGLNFEAQARRYIVRGVVKLAMPKVNPGARGPIRNRKKGRVAR